MFGCFCYFKSGSFRKLGVPYFGGPYNKDPTIKGAILGSPIVGNSHVVLSLTSFMAKGQDTMTTLVSLAKLITGKETIGNKNMGKSGRDCTLL